MVLSKHKTEKQNSQPEPRTANGANKRLASPVTTPVSYLSNEFDIPSVVHGQVRFAAVNQICVIHEAMKGCKNLKIHLKLASKMQI